MQVSSVAKIFPGFKLVAQTTTFKAPHIVAFRSGASRPADFDGYAACNEPIGVAATNLSGPMLERVVSYLDGGGKVFVDSGVFCFASKRTVDFTSVLATYATLCREARRPQCLSLVMPDIIGDAHRTSALLAEHREAIETLRLGGATVIVPLQRGAASLVEAHDLAVSALGHDKFCAGIPCKKQPWTPSEVFALAHEKRPMAIHLLGLGAANRLLPEYLDGIRDTSPSCVISIDSCHLRSMIGQDAPLTVATRAIRDRASEALDDLAPLLAHLWPDLNALTGAVQRFSEAFGYGDDETELLGEMAMPNAFSEDEYAWLARHVSHGSEEQDIRAIARHWVANGLVFDDMHERQDALQQTHQRARTQALVAITRIEQAGQRLRKRTLQDARRSTRRPSLESGVQLHKRAKPAPFGTMHE